MSMLCNLALCDMQNMCTLSKVGTVLKAAAGLHSDLKIVPERIFPLTVITKSFKGDHHTCKQLDKVLMGH